MKIAILSGAGLSAESGLGTFRDKDGLWTKYDLEDVATPSGYRRDPKLVHGFYRARRENCVDAEPNAAHHALVALQQSDHDLSEKIDIFFDRLVLAGFDMLHAAPDAVAFETALGDASKEAIAATQQADVDAMAQVFEHAAGLEKLGISPEAFANFFVSSAMNAKRQAQSREELEEYLNMLKALSLNTCRG